MTSEHLKNLIKKEPHLKDDELTEEEEAFLYRAWEDLTEEEQRLYYEVWSEEPDTLEYAARHAGCTVEEMKTAIKVIRTIRSSWLNAGAHPADFDTETTADELLTLLERAVKAAG